ncbi:hypothetical protein [Leptospira kirschneri]|uniref:hypothetical protein n=1 Tax=Leptospira kirschneri TaxID=29507 RepID=UPI003FED5180
MLLTFFLYIFAGLLSRYFFLCSQRKRIETFESTLPPKVEIFLPLFAKEAD